MGFGFHFYVFYFASLLDSHYNSLAFFNYLTFMVLVGKICLFFKDLILCAQINMGVSLNLDLEAFEHGSTPEKCDSSVQQELDAFLQV